MGREVKQHYSFLNETILSAIYGRCQYDCNRTVCIKLPSIKPIDFRYPKNMEKL